MAELQLFISSSRRRRWGRRWGFRRATLASRVMPVLTLTAFAAAGFAAFWVGRFGI
jgi:hypothetical protein